METFVKAAGLILLALILWIMLSNYSKNFAILLSAAVCCAVGVMALGYLKDVLSFFQSLQRQSGWNSELLEVLFKAVGIGLIAELATVICSDAGNNALGKMITFLAMAVTLWISLPLFSGLLELIGQILGEV